MSKLTTQQVTMIIDQLELPNGHKIYSHEDFRPEILQKIVRMNDHETVYHNIDRVICDHQHSQAILRRWL